MATTTTRTLVDRSRGIERMIVALSRNPEEWDPGQLVLLKDLEGAIAETRRRAVLGMREHGTSDKQIAEALGITQQAVSKRWPGGGRFVGAAGRYRSPNTTTQEASSC